MLGADDILRKIKLIKLLELNVLQSYNLTDSVKTATQAIINETTDTLVDNTTELISTQIMLKTFDADSVAHKLCVEFYKANKPLYTIVIERTFSNLINCCNVLFYDVLLEFTHFQQMEINFHNFRTLIQTIKFIDCNYPEDNLLFSKCRLKDLTDLLDGAQDFEKIILELSEDISEYEKEVEIKEVDIKEVKEVPRSGPKSKFMKLLGLLALLPMANDSNSNMPSGTSQGIQKYHEFS